MNIANLSDACLLEIFKYLSALDQLKFSLVCRKWGCCLLKNLNINDSLIKEYVQIYDDKKGFAEFLNNILTICGSYLNTLNIIGNNNFQDFLLDSEISHILLIISKYCKNIIKINIISYKKWYISNLDVLFKNNCNLHSISLRNLFIEGNCFAELQPLKIEKFEAYNLIYEKKSSFTQFLSKLKNLKIIHICDPVDIFGIQIDVISALNYSNCENISDFFINVNQLSELSPKAICNLLVKQKNLKKIVLDDKQSNSEFLDKLPKTNLEFLKLTFSKDRLPDYDFGQYQNLTVLDCEIDNFTDKAINGIAECTNLKELRILAYNNSLTKEGESYFKRFQKLESLKVFYEKEQNIDHTLVALSQCKNLEKIYFDFSCEFTDYGMSSISLLPNLTHLDIEYSNATDEQMINLVKNARKLKKLNVNGCKQLSYRFVEEASEVKKHRNDKHYLTIIYYTTVVFKDIKTMILMGSEIDIEKFKNISPLILLKTSKTRY